MRFAKAISLLALGALVTTGIMPANARDTRTETDRPRIESGGGGDSRPEEQAKPRLPKSTVGVRCVIKEGHSGFGAQLVNGTGKVIFAGSVVTVYIQPGNVQKQFVLETDWLPGDPLPVPLKGVELTAVSTCAVKVEFAEPKPPASTPDMWKFTCEEYLPFSPGSLKVENTTPYPIPEGTHIKVTVMPGPVEYEVVTWGKISNFGGIVFEDLLAAQFPNGIESCSAEVVY